MSSPHHVVDERVVFAIGTSPTFMQNARGQFQNGRPSYLHVITPANYLHEIVKIGETSHVFFRVLREQSSRTERTRGKGSGESNCQRRLWNNQGKLISNVLLNEFKVFVSFRKFALPQHVPCCAALCFVFLSGGDFPNCQLFFIPIQVLVVEKLDSEEIFTLTVMIGNEWLIEFFDSSTHVFVRINIDLVLNLLYRARVVEIKISRSKYE